ncbi:MAG TPA: serpin family protein [Terriglobales bacterium]|nr:serpin family protein [Terriglobales bacterium]
MRRIAWLAALLLAGISYLALAPEAALRAAPPQPARSLSHAHNAFGFKMLKLLEQSEGKKNVFISPSSIALALSMVYNGARGPTQAAMQKTLDLDGMDLAQVNQQSLDLINLLKNPDPKVQLAVADSVWARKGVSFRPDFLKTVLDFYQAQATTLDFRTPGAAATINAWVNEKTRGKIPTIVEPPIPPDMVMYLINAVYFKGSWTTAFDKNLTEQRTFTPASGAAEKRPLMKQHGWLPYLETDDFQSVSLPYGSNRRLAMYVFLPKKDLKSFLAKLDDGAWDSWMQRYSNTEGTILLPRFKMEYEKELRGTLTQLGMGEAFQDGADLSGIGPGLAISEVKHKTYVDVNEEGTEAAAVTSVGVHATAVRVEPPTFYMEVNRPFLFAIRDNQTGEVLFLGVVQNP